MSTGQIQVCEMYTTIQGEGPNSGKPVLLIRLFGTNVHDKTDLQMYAVNTDKKNLELNRHIYTTEEMLDVIYEAGKGINNWLITGGEPLIQQKEILKVVEAYEERYGNKPFIEVETNGLIKPLKTVDAVIDAYQVQVKLGNAVDGIRSSTMSSRIKDDVLTWFVDNLKAVFSFKAKDVSDCQEVITITESFGIDKERVWLRPLGAEVIGLRNSMFILWDFCIKHKFQLSSRMHLTTFGTKKRGI